MIPLPAQGAMLYCCYKDAFTLDALSQLNDIETEIVTYIERQFLKTLEGGCTAPIELWHVIMKKKIPFIFRSFIFA
jgi:hydroxymethylbilane synthase